LWIEKYNRHWTTGNYLSTLNEYCNFTNKNPTQLIEEAGEDLKAGKLMDERRIFEEFLRYVAFLNTAKIAPNTKLLKIAGIASFFKNIYIDVPTSRINIPIEPLVKSQSARKI